MEEQILRTNPDSLGQSSPEKRVNIDGIIHAAGVLKHIKRAGWVKKAAITDAESVADHSFRMAILGMILGKEAGLDSGKVVGMCLLHDLAESVIGDKMPEEKKSELDHRKEESKVLESLFAPFPIRAKKVMRSLVIELMEGKTMEARLTWDIDRLEMNIQRVEYIKEGHDVKKLSKFDSRKSLSKLSKGILDQYESWLKIKKT